MQDTYGGGPQAFARRLSPIVAGLLVLTSVLLQVADSKITQHDSDLAERDRRIANLLSNQIQVNLMLLRWNLFEASQGGFSGMDPYLLVNDADKSIYDALRTQFKKGDITGQQYAYQMVEFYGGQYLNVDRQYNAAAREYALMKQLGTAWRWWKAVFIVLNIAFACSTLVLTLVLLRGDFHREGAEHTSGGDRLKAPPQK